MDWVESLLEEIVKPNALTGLVKSKRTPNSDSHA